MTEQTWKDTPERAKLDAIAALELCAKMHEEHARNDPEPARAAEHLGAARALRAAVRELGER
jgi:hypothetical protein